MEKKRIKIMVWAVKKAFKKIMKVLLGSRRSEVKCGGNYFNNRHDTRDLRKRKALFKAQSVPTFCLCLKKCLNLALL
jgi:hypothetical protein